MGFFDAITGIIGFGALIHEQIEIETSDRMAREAMYQDELWKKQKKEEEAKEKAFAEAGGFSYKFERPDEDRKLQRNMFAAVVQEGVLLYKVAWFETCQWYDKWGNKKILDGNQYKSEQDISRFGNPKYNSVHEPSYKLIPDYCLWFIRDENGDVIRNPDGSPMLSTELERWIFAKEWYGESKYRRWYGDADPYIPSNIIPTEISADLFIPEDSNECVPNVPGNLDYFRNRYGVRFYCGSFDYSPYYGKWEGNTHETVKLEGGLNNNYVNIDWTSNECIIETLANCRKLLPPSMEYRYDINGNKIEKFTSHIKKCSPFEHDVKNHVTKYNSNYYNISFYKSYEDTYYRWRSIRDYSKYK